jgi:hypothetical protein
MMDDKLAQPDADMFERNIGHLARRGKEVEIWLRGVPEPRIGFIAGLDDQYVQICLTNNQTLSQLHRNDIVTLEETGQSLGILARDDILGEEELDRIKERVEHFRRKASALYPKG